MITIDKSQIKSITLLSAKKARALPMWILANGKWWWLRSPGSNSNDAAFVLIDGSVICIGCDVNLGSGAVRPALTVENLPNLEIGETVKVLGRIAQYIGNDMVLFAKSIGYHQFDAENNDYEHSEIKAWLEEWLRRRLSGKSGVVQK